MRCVDLFAGCGGLSLGFQRAGFDVVAAYDNWIPALEIYKKNFSHPIYNLDLMNGSKAIAAIASHHPDLIMGGPPCQDFSSAGKRDLSLGRASLTYDFANIVCAIKPKWFVMENVEQIKKSQILKAITDQFFSHHYGLSSVILNAAYCGVPQARTRLFLIGHFQDKHNQVNSILKARLSKEPMTVRDYLGDSLGIEFYYRHPRNYNRRGIFSIDEPSPTIRGVNRPIPQGYKLNSCDPKGISLNVIRPLTTLERSYIQTFPKFFKFEGTKTSLEQMIGNAVPVALARYVAEGIKIYMTQGTVHQSAPKSMVSDREEPFSLPTKPLHREFRLTDTQSYLQPRLFG
ncbi:DNA cytosine methyltransferase [Prochlorothrix hollandica]|uniref:Cytosine-specific methyltransferase n=2 Tax=Prochlorothrix hollandica TaxID=1223 RepID=A0A0M2Q334_PROHO|nr:DNA cytosine methyltransferase [Prochlorothrix hollandica]KKJ01354.1 modification methylase [Prochlorothrix hollandica PCC 9006 = CALU 1027]